MQVQDAIASIAGLATVEGRAVRAREFAVSMGAQALLLFTLRADSGKFVPAAGGPKTLPGGQGWRALLDACRTRGVHQGEVIALEERAGPLPAAACSDGATALVFLGGSVARADLDLVGGMLPLLGAALHEQQKLSITAGELAAAHFEMKQYASLTSALDAARAKVDVTMRELAQQARRLEEARGQAENAARAKDEFLAMLGHELRNPLAPLVTVLQVLRLRGQWTPELGIMQRQVDHMQRLVDDLLDVSRIAGGKLTLQRRKIELSEAIRAAHETAQPLIVQKSQHVFIDIPATGLLVDADPARLAQVFANLFTNAAKYSDQGTTIRAQATVHHHDVVVEIIDQGIGIQASMLGRVFDIFEQQGSSIDRAEGGLGLGLAIVRNLVQQHGGHVHVDSAGLGKGSRFVVTLPLASGSAEPEAAVAAPPARWVQPGERILLVDDNADALATLAEALRVAGYTVEVAADGHSALECARDFAPRLALLDIGLPGMDGYELATRLRSDGDPALKLVALTGYGQSSDKQRALDSGFDRHLTKPVDFPRLQGVIEALLETPA